MNTQLFWRPSYDVINVLTNGILRRDTQARLCELLLFISDMHLGCPRNSADTEFRLFFFTSVYSVFRAELAAIPAEFRRIPCRKIP